MPLPAQAFDTYYPSTPFDGTLINKHIKDNVLDPILRDVYMRRSIYSVWADMNFSFDDMRAESMTLTDVIAPHANATPLDQRQQWIRASHIDSYSRTLYFKRWGGKLALSQYDHLISHWIRQGRSQAGLIPLVNSFIGPMATDTLDIVARNTFLSSPIRYYGDGSGTGFSDIAISDTITPEVFRAIFLGMKSRIMPYENLHTGNGAAQRLVVITSPGVAHDLRTLMYDEKLAPIIADIMSQISLIETDLAVLYNCGEVIGQASVSAAIRAGEGAPDPATTPVLNRSMGQSGSSIKRYIQLASSTDMAPFEVGDIVTVHTLKNASDGTTGVAGGVNFTDGFIQNRRIVAVDTSNKRLTFDKMIMEDFTDEIDTGVYAYVTKGRHIHSAVAIAKPGAIRAGILHGVQVKTPMPIDDWEEMYRVAWQARMDYTVWEPEAFELWLGAGSIRTYGSQVVIQ